MQSSIFRQKELYNKRMKNWFDTTAKKNVGVLGEPESSSCFSKERAQEQENHKTEKTRRDFYLSEHHIKFGALQFKWEANGGESVQGRTRKIKNPENVTQRKYGFSLEGLRSHITILMSDCIRLKGRYEEK